MMNRILKNLAIAAGGALALSACGGGSGNVATTTPTAPTTPPAASFQARISTAFAARFDASATSEPVKPTTADVPALSLTTEPIDN